MADAPLEAEQLALVGLLVDRQAAARGTLTSRALGAVMRIVGVLRRGAAYNDRLVASTAAQAAAEARRAQDAAAAVTQAYLEQTLGVLGAPRPRVVPPLPEPLRPVDPVEQWTRPAEQYRYARSTGASEQDALAAAALRAETLVRDDVALAVRHAARSTLQRASQVRGYRRVIRPERSAGGSCGLCVAASDRVYQVSELLPVHERCQCEVTPWLRGQADPGRALNVDELDLLYGSSGSNTAADLKRTRWRVDEHGELGPVLLAANAPPADDRPSALAA